MAKKPENEPDHEESVDHEESIEPEEESSEEGSEDDSPSPLDSAKKVHSPLSSPSSSSSSEGKLPTLPSSSEDSDDEDSDSDSDDLPVKKLLDPVIKPIATKPITFNPSKPSASAARKPRSKVGTTGPTSPPKVGVKRAADKQSEAKDTKKPKKKTDSAVGGESSEKKATSSSVGGLTGDDPKKQLFQRLWSEEDEIVILKGILDYSAKKKADPVADIGAFLEFIKKSLHIDVTKQQLQDKVRRLKKKFENNAGKEKDGKERTFSKAHEGICYELSKKIWEKPVLNNGAVNEKVLDTPKTNRSSGVRKKRTPNVTPSPKVNEVDDDDELKDAEAEENGIEVLKKCNVGGDLGSCSVAEWIMNDGAKMLKAEKREEMEQKWKEVRKQEVEVFVKRTELLCEQAKLVLESMRNPGQ